MEMEWRSFDERRHWAASSQIDVPVDVLLEYLDHGWSISPVVGREDHWYGGGRHITVHYFELTMNNQAVVMPVLDNPVVCRLMHDYQLRIVLLNRDDVRSLQDKVFVP
jgi:hypothetical protein